MPVAGAFEADEEKHVLALRDGYKESREAEPLLSAIPPAPTGNEQVLPSERKKRFRLIIASSIAALILVTGTTLFITRPWDPYAYVTHAMEDADTSMEGSLEHMTHLRSQDFAKDAERKEYMWYVQKSLDIFDWQMGAVAQSADGSESVLMAYVKTGAASGLTGNLALARTLQEQLKEKTEAVRALKPTNDEQQEQLDYLLLLATYLQGEMDALVQVWTSVEQAPNPTEGMTAARVAIGTKVDGNTLEQWHDLFRNAYHEN